MWAVQHCGRRMTRPAEMRKSIGLLVALVLTGPAAPTVADAGNISGRAGEIDGDTMEIHGNQRAALALSDKIGQRTASCEQRDVDRYRRIVAVCRADNEDLNGWLVSEGWAVAYRRFSTDYVPAENAARSAKHAIWAGTSTPPEESRRGKNGESATKPSKTKQPAECVIKGNISRRTGERIYHVPGGEFYDRTRIDRLEGERWFCSEEEAKAAGWRRSIW